MRPAGCAGRILAGKPLAMPRRLRRHYLEAVVVLFSMFTTCTRRLISAIGWPGSFSLLLPYPTVTRSVPLMPYLSTRYFLIDSARRSDRFWLYSSPPAASVWPATTKVEPFNSALLRARPSACTDGSD